MKDKRRCWKRQQKTHLHFRRLPNILNSLLLQPLIENTAITILIVTVPTGRVYKSVTTRAVSSSTPKPRVDPMSRNRVSCNNLNEIFYLYIKTKHFIETYLIRRASRPRSLK